MQLSKYEVISSISLSEGRKLVLFNPFVDHIIDPEMSGRELFLLDKNDEIIWNVDVRRDGENQGIDGRPKDQFGLVGDDGFINLFQKDGKFILRSYRDMIFEVDIETGKAKFLYWTRSNRFAYGTNLLNISIIP